MGMAGRKLIEWGPFPEIDTVTVDGRECVTTAKAAKLAKVEPATLLAYSRRGQAPTPAGKVERVLMYDLAEIREWLKNRPGSGTRTDLRKKPTEAAR